MNIIKGVIMRSVGIKWRISWGYLGRVRRNGKRWEWMTGLDGSKGGFEKAEELVWVWVEGDGSEFANSSGVSTSELLNCEMV